MKLKNVCLIVFSILAALPLTQLPGFEVARTTVSASNEARATCIIIPVAPQNPYLLTDAAHGVRFDINGDGVEEQISWTAPNSGLGFLALDRNGNGKIDNGKELYGSFTVRGENNGFSALSHDAASVELGVGQRVGMVELGNPLYDKLLLWTDENHNGLSEPHELQPLKDLYSSITMAFGETDQKKDKNGNLFYFEGNATIRTGPGLNRQRTPEENRERLVAIYDVFFRDR